MSALESRINSAYFWSLMSENIPTIFELKRLTGYYSLILPKPKMNEILKGIPQEGIFKDVSQIFSFIYTYYSKNGKWAIPEDGTPLPEPIIPFYHRIIDYLIKSN